MDNIHRELGYVKLLVYLGKKKAIKKSDFLAVCEHMLPYSIS